MRFKLLFHILLLCAFISTAQEEYYINSSESITPENINDFEQDESSITKYEFKETLSDKYDGKRFQYDDEKKKKEKKETNTVVTDSGSKAAGRFFGSLIQLIGLILIVALVIYIVYVIMNREGSWRFGRSSDKNVVQIKSVEEDIENVNIDKLIQQAIANKDYRLAIRYYYLNTLKFLAQKEFIKYHPEKTNADYYNELQNAEKKDAFSYLSYIYNYIWYGEFDIDENKFLIAEKSFNDFKK